jgi:hypothetical protein
MPRLINANPSQLDAHFCTYIYSVRYGIVRATVREWARLYIYKNRTPAQEQLLKLLTVIAGEVLRLQNVNAKHIGDLEENNDYVWYAGWNYDVYQRPVPSFLQKICNRGGIRGITKWLSVYQPTATDTWTYN